MLNYKFVPSHQYIIFFPVFVVLKKEMVYAKIDALSEEDLESSLLPFMMVAAGCDVDD